MRGVGADFRELTAGLFSLSHARICRSQCSPLRTLPVRCGHEQNQRRFVLLRAGMFRRILVVSFDAHARRVCPPSGDIDVDWYFLSRNAYVRKFRPRRPGISFRPTTNLVRSPKRSLATIPRHRIGILPGLWRQHPELILPRYVPHCDPLHGLQPGPTFMLSLTLPTPSNKLEQEASPARSCSFRTRPFLSGPSAGG